jgi:hypothetical protein
LARSFCPELIETVDAELLQLRRTDHGAYVRIQAWLRETMGDATRAIWSHLHSSHLTEVNLGPAPAGWLCTPG